ncbi:MAG: PAS domain S-box protein [Deltaproteobacteria bacterium]|nr:PAS domain S-box protein [Deltaproteobacteria bacterium]
MTIIQDMMKRGQAEGAVKESEAYFRAITENSSDIIFVVDAQGTITYASPSVKRFVGYRPDELIGTNGFDLILPEDNPRAIEDFARALLTKEVVIPNAFRIRHKDGTERILEGVGKNLLDNPNVAGFVMNIRDITEHKRVEEALRQSEAKYRAIFENATEGIFQISLDGAFISVNPAFARIYGYETPEELIFKVRHVKHQIYAHPEDRGRIRRLLAESGEIRGLECEFIDRQGRKIWASINAHNICDAHGRILYYEGTVEDITKEKILERQVIHQEKLASLGMLVSGIAHEINNPNNFITFNIPILRDYIGELMRIADGYADGHPDYELFGMTYSEFREDIFNLIDNIEHGTGRIDGTVRKLQEFSRKKNDEERRLADVEEIVRKAVAICSSQIGRMVKVFEVEMAPGLPSMLTDADALEQILINILINAGQAADKKESRIALRVVGGASWENRIIIEIEDNGAGMDQATKDSVFIPFFTTKSRGKGTGLGLYIAKNLIDGLGGAIEVESEPGRGSLFRIIIPELNIHA